MRKRRFIRSAARVWLLKYGVALALAGIVVLITLWLRPVGQQMLFFLAIVAVLFSTVYGGFGPGLVATVVTFSSTVWLMTSQSSASSVLRWDELFPLSVFLSLLLLITLFSSRRLLLLGQTDGLKKRSEQRQVMLENMNRELKQHLADRERADEERLHLVQKARSAADDVSRQKIEWLAALEQLLSIAGVGLATLNREFQYLRINEFFGTVSGLSADTYRGRSMQDATPRLWPMLNPVLRQVRQIGQAVPWQEISVETSPGRGPRAWLISCYPIKAASGQNDVIGVIMMDITECKRAPDLVSKQAQEVARAQAILKRISHMASHDLKEPLLTITNDLKLLAQRYRGKLDDNADQLIAQTLVGIQKLDRSIADLVSYLHGDVQSQVPGAVEIKNVVDRALRNLEADIGASRAIVTHDALPTVKGNFTDLVLLFQNLLEQAIKIHGATPARIHVSATPRKRSEDQASEWVFSLRDNGRAIEPRAVDRIFLVYEGMVGDGQQSDNSTGLAACKKIIDANGGGTWVEFQPGAGSILYFSLPHA